MPARHDLGTSRLNILGVGPENQPGFQRRLAQDAAEEAPTTPLQHVFFIIGSGAAGSDVPAAPRAHRGRWLPHGALKGSPRTAQAPGRRRNPCGHVPRHPREAGEHARATLHGSGQGAEVGARRCRAGLRPKNSSELSLSAKQTSSRGACGSLGHALRGPLSAVFGLLLRPQGSLVSITSSFWSKLVIPCFHVASPCPLRP